MACMRAAKARKRVADCEGMPVREVRGIEVVILDSHRPMTTIKARQYQDDEGRWGRLHVDGFSGRPVGRSGFGRLIAGAVL